MSTQLKDPLNTVFDIDTTGQGDLDDYDQITEGELVALKSPNGAPEKDAEDIEVDSKIDKVYVAAMDAYNDQAEMVQILEPRYAARNAEVAATYLNIALQAAATRARVKGDRKRIGTFIPGMGGKVTNNTIVASREEILRMISVDADTKEV